MPAMATLEADRSHLGAFLSLNQDGTAPGLPRPSLVSAAPAPAPAAFAAPAAVLAPKLALAQAAIAASAATPLPLAHPAPTDLSSAADHFFESRRSFSQVSPNAACDVPVHQPKWPKLSAEVAGCGGGHVTTDSECEQHDGDYVTAAAAAGVNGNAPVLSAPVPHCTVGSGAYDGATASKRLSRVGSIDELEARHSRILTRCPSCRLRLKAKKFSAQEFILMCPSQTCIFPLDRPDLRTYMMTREELVGLIHTRRRLRALRCAARSSPGGASNGSCDSISVSGDETLEPDIGAIDLSWADGRWANDDWGEGGDELFEDMWGCKKQKAD